MLTFYIVVGLITVGVILAIVLMTRSRRQPAPAEAAGIAAHGPKTLIRIVGEEPAPERPKDFDGGETLVYLRAAPPAEAGRRERDAAGPAVTAGARLVGLSGAFKGRSFPIGAAGLAVGRSPHADIVLGDPRVSLRHAWIGLVDGQAMLRDLGSTNGTFLNAHLNARVSETPLRTGDTIFFGGHQGDQFRFLAE